MQAAAPLLTLAGGVAVADGIRAATGLPVQIKWPNDIVVADGAGPARRRKLAGILAEASTGAGRSAVRHPRFRHQPAAGRVSAGAGGSRDVDRDRARPARRTAARCWPKRSPRFAACSSGLRRARRIRCSPAGARSRRRRAARRSNGTRRTASWSGTAAGIADDGALLVRVGDRVERIISGELRWL